MQDNTLGITTIKSKIKTFLEEYNSTLYFIPHDKIDTLLFEYNNINYYVTELHKEYVVIEILTGGLHIGNFNVNYFDIEFEFNLFSTIKLVEIVNELFLLKNFETKLI